MPPTGRPGKSADGGLRAQEAVGGVARLERDLLALRHLDGRAGCRGASGCVRCEARRGAGGGGRWRWSSSASSCRLSPSAAPRAPHGLTAAMPLPRVHRHGARDPLHHVLRRRPLRAHRHARRGHRHQRDGRRLALHPRGARRRRRRLPGQHQPAARLPRAEPHARGLLGAARPRGDRGQRPARGAPSARVRGRERPRRRPHRRPEPAVGRPPHREQRGGRRQPRGRARRGGRHVRDLPGRPARPLWERLLAALEAGKAAGGQPDGEKSSGLYVVDREPFAVVDLRVDLDPEPVRELRRLADEYFPLIAYYGLRPFDPDVPRADEWLARERARRGS